MNVSSRTLTIVALSFAMLAGIGCKQRRSDGSSGTKDIVSDEVHPPARTLADSNEYLWPSFGQSFLDRLQAFGLKKDSQCFQFVENTTSSGATYVSMDIGKGPCRGLIKEPILSTQLGPTDNLNEGTIFADQEHTVGIGKFYRLGINLYINELCTAEFATACDLHISKGVIVSIKLAGDPK